VRIPNLTIFSHKKTIKKRARQIKNSVVPYLPKEVFPYSYFPQDRPEIAALFAIYLGLSGFGVFGITGHFGLPSS